MRKPDLIVLLLSALCLVGCGNASKNATEGIDNDSPNRKEGVGAFSNE